MLGPQTKTKQLQWLSCKDFMVGLLLLTLGFWMEIENTYGNSERKLKKHFSRVRSSLDPQHLVKMGEGRFMKIRSSLNPTKEELLELISILVSNSRRSVLF